MSGLKRLNHSCAKVLIRHSGPTAMMILLKIAFEKKIFGEILEGELLVSDGPSSFKYFLKIALIG